MVDRYIEICHISAGHVCAGMGKQVGQSSYLCVLVKVKEPGKLLRKYLFQDDESG